MREQMLGYLLGALDASEQEELERELQDNPELEHQLRELQDCLEPLEASWGHYEPPPGLAERTCARVASPERQAPEKPAQVKRATSRPAAAASHWREQGDSAAGHRLALADLVVAAGIFLAASLLFFPAVASSRHAAQIRFCQNNLRELGQVLYLYSQHQGQQRFPYIPPQGNRGFAGFYGSSLQEAELLDNPRLLICSSSPMARNLGDWYVPTFAELDQASGRMLQRLQRMAGGSYGYNLGVLFNGRHVAPRNQGRAHFALMMDAPSLYLVGRKTANHGGLGQNVLFEDGHVRYIVGCPGEACHEDPLLNWHGKLEAGVNPDDAVLGSSLTRPFYTGFGR